MATPWTVGQEGEQYAAQQLYRRGYLILERNWRSKPYEVDIIALTEELLVFLEVKTRIDPGYAVKRWGMSKAKQRSLVNAAYEYMESISWYGEFRFDLITLNRWGKEWELTHYEEAFFPGIQGV